MVSEDKPLSPSAAVHLKGNALQTKIYKRRWLILLLYVGYAAINAFQWFEYSIISNIMKKYYQVTSVEVDWTSIIYVILYMPLVIPASYIIGHYELRTTVLIGCLMTTLGTTIKCISFSPNSIWLIYLGQTLLSSVQVIILPLPPKLAMVWFGSEQVSLACCLGVFGTQLGQAIGLLVPPIVVKNHESIGHAAQDLSRLTYVLSGCSACVTIAVILYFPSEPPKPPSRAQANKDNNNRKFLASWKRLMLDKALIQHALAYGINVGVFIGVSTLLNELMLMHFEGSEVDAGRIGLLSIFFGLVGSVVVGFVLDRFKTYKQTCLALYIISGTALGVIMLALHLESMPLTYFSLILFGFAVNTYTPAGLELAIELTYPEQEYISSGILISMTQACGGVFIFILGHLLRQYGSISAIAILLVFFFFGVILTYALPNRQMRQSFLRQ